MALTTVEQLIAKRRALWRGDIAQDTAYIQWAAKRLLSTPAMRRQVRQRPYLLVQAVMQVVDKRQQLVPFFFNDVQADFVRQLAAAPVGRPLFVLKGRQQGFTTLITAIQLCYCLVRCNFSGFTLADTAENAATIFADKAKALYARLPPALRPKTKYNSRKELVFGGLGSGWRVGTAGENLGRSRTLHFVHYSEVAFYRCPLSALQRSLGEATTADAIVVYESTANGYNSAKDLWDSGACVNLFYAWWRTAEYRLNAPLPNNPDPWLVARLQWLRSMGLDQEQLSWYAAKYAGYLDKQSIRQEYPCTPDEAWLTTGECEFDRDSVLQALMSVRPDLDRVGYFACRVSHDDNDEKVCDIRWVDDPEGCIRLHSPPASRNEGGRTLLHPYAIGGDTAGEGSDWYSAKVVSGITGETVATLHICHTDDDLYALQVYALGVYYNQAVIAIEVNFSLMPMRLLQRWGYQPLYRRLRRDDITGTTQQRVGFCTNAQTRPVILANLKSIWRVNSGMEKDKDTLLEMLSFVRVGGRPQAAYGKHDDLVMALAIAHYAAEYAREWVEQPIEDDDWIHSHFHLPPNGA